MTLSDRMALWASKEGYEEIAAEERTFTGPDDIDLDEDDMPDSWLSAYQEFVLSNDAYEWLLTRLRRELHLASAKPNIIRAIRATIMSSLPTPHRISRKVSSKSYRARVELDWDIFDFFQSQRYSMPPDEALDGVITLTGSCHDAQAATCAQYTRQTWPLTGEAILQLVKEVLRDGEGHSHLCKWLPPTNRRSTCDDYLTQYQVKS